MVYIFYTLFLYISIPQINAQPTIGKTTITELSIIKSKSNKNSKHDPIIFIRNPIEAEVPSHWIPQPVLKVIMETQREDKPVHPKIHSTTVKVPLITNHHDVKLYTNNITTQKSSKLTPLLKHMHIPEEQPAIDSGPVSDVNSESAEPQENIASGNAESVDSNGGTEEILNSENSNQEDVDADPESSDANQEDDDANQEDDDANQESGDANQDENNEDNDNGSAKSGDEESVAESEESIEVTEAPTTKRISKKRGGRKPKHKPRMLAHVNSRS